MGLAGTSWPYLLWWDLALSSSSKLPMHGCLRCSIAGDHVLHVILLGVRGITYIPHTLVPLKSLGLDLQSVKKLALKLYAHFVRNAHKFVQTRRYLEHSPHLQTNQVTCLLATFLILSDRPFLSW